MNSSSYTGHSSDKWSSITQGLVDAHPLRNSIVQVVLDSWTALFTSNIGGLTIGTEILPAPQITGFLLESLIAHKLSVAHPGAWKRGTSKTEKDVVCLIKDKDFLSLEIKCSSSGAGVYANKSYTKIGEGATKLRDSYYLVVNFQNISNQEKFPDPKVTKIRFGFLSHGDWKAQASDTGQNATLSKETKKGKLITLYPLPKEKSPKPTRKKSGK